MKTRKDIAAARKLAGKHNCAQAVLCTYCDLCGIDEAEAMAIGAAFGVGMGTMDGTCGALVGAGIAAGLMNRDRVQTMKDMRQIITQFKQQNGATQCRELKGVDTHQPLRECHLCVADAAHLLEKATIERKQINQ